MGVHASHIAILSAAATDFPPLEFPCCDANSADVFNYTTAHRPCMHVLLLRLFSLNADIERDRKVHSSILLQRALTCDVCCYIGAHINPAVTLAMAVAGRLNWIKVPLYWMAQYVGSFVGAACVYLVYCGQKLFLFLRIILLTLYTGLLAVTRRRWNPRLYRRQII